MRKLSAERCTQPDHTAEGLSADPPGRMVAVWPAASAFTGFQTVTRVLSRLDATDCSGRAARGRCRGCARDEGFDPWRPRRVAAGVAGVLVARCRLAGHWSERPCPRRGPFLYPPRRDGR